ncbi:MAG TPA: hypothetical protein VGY98_00775 [Verrucomicrobiae bacterium]|nr:hypothetical protein [Verrucomicrobiae bacterium]
MTNLPPKKIPAFEPLSQRKTIFLPAPGREGILVEILAGRRRARNCKFAGRHVGAACCLKYPSDLVFFFDGDPSQS